MSKQNQKKVLISNINPAKEEKAARKKTFLDRRFEEFVAEVTKAIREGKCSVYFCGKTVKFSQDPTSLEHLLEIKVGDKQFSLSDTLESKARLAVDGFLGAQLVDTGKRCLAAVEERIQRNRIKDARRRCFSLWGDLGDYAWKLKQGATHSPKIAEVTKKMVDYIAAHNGHVPTTFGEARAAGLQFPFLTGSEWAFIKKIAAGAAAWKAQRTQPQAEKPANPQ